MGFSVSMGKSQILGRLLYDYHYHSHGSKYEKLAMGGIWALCVQNHSEKVLSFFNWKDAAE